MEDVKAQIERGPSDACLVERALSGDAEAFRPIVTRYQSAVFAVALSRVRDFHAAEDVAQQVFIEVFERLPSLKEPAKLGGWLRTIAIRQAVNLIRSRRDEVQLDDEGRDGLLVGDANVDVERNDLKRRVVEAVGRLKRALRETTTLFYIGGYSIDDIASMQEIPGGTVKRRLHDARKQLKEDMLAVVEDTLRSERPTQDFGQRVFELLSLHGRDNYQSWPWTDVVTELKKIGLKGVDGYADALASPHSPTRKFALKLIDVVWRNVNVGGDGEEVIHEMLREALQDSNKKVRRLALTALGRWDIGEMRMREEIVPLFVERLVDDSRLVRHCAAMYLYRYADAVPLPVAATALADETHPKTSAMIARLIRRIVQQMN